MNPGSDVRDGNPAGRAGEVNPAGAALHASPATATAGRGRTVAAVAALSLLGVAVRCLPWRFVFREGVVAPMGADPYYHLRRAALLVEQFPDWPRRDAFLSFPDGAPIPWPPGFDLLVALPGFLTGRVDGLAAWGSLLVPVLGGVAVALTYALGARAFDRATGLVAAALFAVLAGGVGPGLVGRIDHHALVAPATLGMYVAFLASAAAPTLRGGLAAALACGLLAAVAAGSWIVTPPMYFLPIPAVVLGLAAAGEARRLRVAGLACTGFALAGVVGAVLATGDLEEHPFALYYPSWFLVAPYALAAAFAAVAVWRPRALWAAAAATCIAFLAVAAFAPAWLSPLADGVAVARGADVSYAIAVESFPLLFQDGVFTVGRAVFLYTWAFLLMPLVCAALVATLWRRRERRPGPWLVAAYAPWGTALVLLQQRFGEYAAPAVALAFAWAIAASARRVAQRVRSPEQRRRGLVLAAAGSLGALAVFSPVGAALAHLATDDSVAHQRALVSFARLLRAHTPAAADSARADESPRYGVLASWTDTHPILTAAERPVAASSFATAEALAGNRRAFRMLLTKDGERAARHMRDAGLRYVVVSPIEKEVRAMAGMAGFDAPFVRVELGSGPKGAFERFRPLRPFAEAVHTRLLLADGSERVIRGFRTPPLAHFRLVVESPEPVRLYGVETTRLKAFEAVAGARLAGVAPPGAEVRAAVPIRSNVGREFSWETRAVADPDGRFEIVVPYATRGAAQAPTAPVAPYAVRAGGRSAAVHVPEEAVRSGAEVAVPPLSGASPLAAARGVL